MTKGSRLLIIAVIAQMAVLVGMYVTAALPLWTGAEIRLATAPVGPRSLFRGNYALLSYDISEIDSTYF
ncbi:MAG: GDYXXLXY domain-containing protein [Gammaproteobacteria bacterium]|nr:GDYXXLXY domain-containing protein [Gammaproteobacteria bacterium]